MFEAPITNSLRRVMRSGVSKVQWIGDQFEKRGKRIGSAEWQVGRLAALRAYKPQLVATFQPKILSLHFQRYRSGNTCPLGYFLYLVQEWPWLTWIPFNSTSLLLKQVYVVMSRPYPLGFVYPPLIGERRILQHSERVRARVEYSNLKIRSLIRVLAIASIAPVSGTPQGPVAKLASLTSPQQGKLPMSRRK